MNEYKERKRELYAYDITFTDGTTKQLTMNADKVKNPLDVRISGKEVQDVTISKVTKTQHIIETETVDNVMHIAGYEFKGEAK